MTLSFNANEPLLMQLYHPDHRVNGNESKFSS